MSREWKSGEVIFDPLGGLRGLVVETGPGCARHIKMDDLHVHYKDGDWDALVPDDARPLVVIDPENREQVERLAKCYRDVHGEAELTDEPWSVPGLRMQAALREFANPVVKPEEPTGRLAVVADADGRNWCRLDERWVSVGHPGAVIEVCRYRDIDAVRVLSDGIPA